jgi:coproporphyrinogen III oxidase-like Fe-S oxidoreductase
MSEKQMLGLRMMKGVSNRAFAERYGQKPSDAFPRSLPRYLELGALEMNGDHLRFRRDALFTADAVLADIVAEGNEPLN